MNDLFRKKLQRRIAQTAITNSALRNQGKPGIIDKCRKYCQALSLGLFFEAIPEAATYKRYLNEHTHLLQVLIRDDVYQLLPPYNDEYRGWGAARKALNLFFENVVFNQFFAAEHNLPHHFESYRTAVQHLEVPLDSHVASKLYEQYPIELPKWTRIKHLNPQLSDQYQTKATCLANLKGIARVQLDIYYWRSEELENLFDT